MNRRSISGAIGSLALTLAAACAAPPAVPEPALDHAEPIVAEAVREAVDAVRVAPRDPGAWRALADRLRACGWSSEAADAYALGAPHADDPFLWAYLEGVSREPADLVRARDAFRRALAASPDDVWTHLRLAEIEERLGDVAASDGHYAAAEKIDPARPRVMMWRVRSALADGDTASARTILTRLESRVPDAAAVHGLRARLESLAGDEVAAERASRLARRDAGALPWDDPRTIPTVPPVGSVAWIREGNRRHRMRDFHGAIEAYREALALVPDRAEVHYALGTSAASAGDFDRAERAYLAALERHPDDAETWFRLGRVRRRAGKLDAAAEAFAKLDALAPDHPGASLERGRLALERGALDTAVLAFRRAIAEEPDDPRGHMHGGIALARRGDRAEAERWLLRAAELDPESADVWYNLAAARSAAGDTSGARQALRRALERRPGDPQIRRAWAALGGGA